MASYVNALDNERIGTQTYVTNLSTRMDNLPNNDDGRAMRQRIQNEIQAARIYLNNVIGELAMARKLLATPAQKEAFWNDFVQARASFLEAS